MAVTTEYTYTLVSMVMVLLKNQAEGIGCFVCTSVNHSDPGCEDTFNNTDNDKYYRADCWAERKGREGLFKGTQCMKMIAEDDEAGFSVVVRNCVVDNGGTNSETEIGRQSHCGWMRTVKYMAKSMTGCILSCDKDACNSDVSVHLTTCTILISSLLTSMINLLF